jgi:hypothetical protein
LVAFQDLGIVWKISPILTDEVVGERSDFCFFNDAQAMLKVILKKRN